MSCNEENNKERRSRPTAVVRFNSWNVLTTNSRRLFVSNHPELVSNKRIEPDPSFPANLYKFSTGIPSSGTFDVRAITWHGHDYNTAKNIILAITVIGGNGSISGHLREVQNRNLGQLYKAGMCCSKAQRLHTPLDAAANPNLPNGVEVLFAIHPVQATGVEDYYVGAVDEFTINGPPFAEVRIRTVISDNDKLPDWDSPLLDTIDGHDDWKHVRGCWPYSDIELQADHVVDLFTEPTQPVGFEIGASNGGDTLLFLDSLGGPDARTNKGLYGVNATYRVQFTNSSLPTQNYYLDGFLRARNVPGKYFGAVADGTTQPGILPLGIFVGTQVASDLFVALDVGETIPIVTLNNATGGACATPVDLVFLWEAHQ